MEEQPKRGPAQMPQLPLRPGRPAFSRQTRFILLLVLVGVLVALIAGGILLAHSSTKARVVTIPKADRNASPALIRAAEQVNFHPPKLDGVGRVEDEPASAAKILTKGLLPVGAQAPDFTLRTPTGTPVSLRDLRGKAVLLELFATWCPHCNAEAPRPKQLSPKLPPSTVSSLSMACNTR